MLKLFLISIVAVPVLLGMRAARARTRRDALARLAGVLLTYDVLYILLLYYLRFRWLGWAWGG
jgi:hypothetical protein